MIRTERGIPGDRAPRAEKLGLHDPFRDPGSWSESTAAYWRDALTIRTEAPDQAALRRALVEEGRVGSGERVLEVGCGVGALLAEVAELVGEGGRVVGVEPQRALAEEGRKRLAGHSNTEIVEAKLADLSLDARSVDCCLAQTTLIHFPSEELTPSLQLIRKLLRVGGRIASADQDGDTWVIDHPDRRITRRIVEFNSDHRYGDGWVGRKLPRLLGEVGFTDISVRPHVHVDRDAGSYLALMAERIAHAALTAGAISAAEAVEWLEQLRDQAARGSFFSSITYFITSARSKGDGSE